MSTWRVSLVCTGIVSIAMFLTLGSANDVYAIDYEPMDLMSCGALPGGGNSWDDMTSTCSKTTNLTIGMDDTLTIPNGVSLVLSTNRELINEDNGIITNFGTITMDGTSGQNGQIRNFDTATFTNFGTINLEGITGPSGRLRNQDDATFTNFGTINLEGTGGSSGRLLNRDDATFTNSGTINLEGAGGSSGRLLNRVDATFTNSGIITISGTSSTSGWLYNRASGIFTNSGTITIDGTNGNSGQFRNIESANFTNLGTIILTGVNGDSGLILNRNVLTNSGTITTNRELDNTLTGSIFNDCSGEITFGTFTGNSIEEETICPLATSSGAYEDPTIGKSQDGRQVVEDGICIDITCWTVTANYHQDFDLVEMLSDSVHTISATVFCQHGVNKCNYVAFGVSPYGTNINDSVWKIILQKDHRDNWTMKIIDPERYLGEVTSTTQIVNDNRFLTASATIEFKKPTPGMILNIEVRDSGGGYRDFKFNDGVEIVDAYAYPSIETSYEPPLEIKPLCLNENVNKRYTCAFEKVRDWTIKNAEAALKEINR